jgi:hypothetical protein
MHTRRGNGRGFDRMAIRPIPRHCPTIAMGAFIMMLGTHDTRHAIRAFTARANGPRRDRGVARQSARVSP